MGEAMTMFSNLLQDDIRVTGDTTLLYRYALLRKHSLLIFAKRDNQDFVLPNHEAFCLVYAKLNYYAHIEANIVSLLNREENEKSFISTLSFILTHTPHVKIGIAEAAKYLENELSEQTEPTKTLALLKALSNDYERNDEIVKNLSEHLGDQGKEAPASWLLKYWESFKAKVEL